MRNSEQKFKFHMILIYGFGVCYFRCRQDEYLRLKKKEEQTHSICIAKIYDIMYSSEINQLYNTQIIKCTVRTHSAFRYIICHLTMHILG